MSILETGSLTLYFLPYKNNIIILQPFNASTNCATPYALILCKGRENLTFTQRTISADKIINTWN
jgi:hypothetical protein